MKLKLLISLSALLFVITFIYFGVNHSHIIIDIIPGVGL